MSDVLTCHSTTISAVSANCCTVTPLGRVSNKAGALPISVSTIATDVKTAETLIRSQVCVGFVTDRLALVQVFSLSTSVSPVSVISQIIHSHEFVNHRRCITLAINSVGEEST